MLAYNYIDIPRPYWTNTSTPEEIYSDLLSFASTFITIDSRLSILEDMSGLKGTYGGIVYIGFADEGIPILSFCNYYNNSSYYYRYMYCSLLEANYVPFCSTSTGYYNKYVSWDVNSTSYKNTSIRLKYLLFKEVLSFDFGLYNAESSEYNCARFFITKLISPEDNISYAHNCFLIYQGYVYCSTDASPGNVMAFQIMQYNNFVAGRYYMIECGLANTMYVLENIYFFSGTKINYTYPQRFIFNDEEYQTFGSNYSTYHWNLCAKV